MIPSVFPAEARERWQGEEPAGDAGQGEGAVVLRVEGVQEGW